MNMHKNLTRTLLTLMIASATLLGVSAATQPASATGTYCQTHECQTPSLDSGPPNLINDGDADADDSTTGGGTITHVVTIMEENHNISTITPTSMPYLSSLGTKYAKATALSAITHPSLPNYFAFTSGQTFGHTTDCGTSTSGCTTAADNIFHQGTWKQLSESMPFACDHSNAGSYVVHHAIPPFYTDLNTTCVANDVPLVKTAVPAISAAYTFITPNNLDNAHSASLGQADNWLKVVVPKLLADPNFVNGSTLIQITFDEGSSGNNTVYSAFIYPTLSGKVITVKGSHYSVLRLDEELLGYPLLAGAKTAPDIRTALGL